MSRAPAILFTTLGIGALVVDLMRQLAAPNTASPQWSFALSCIVAGAIIARLERIARSLKAIAPPEPVNPAKPVKTVPQTDAALPQCQRCATPIRPGWGMCPQCLTPQKGS